MKSLKLFSLSILLITLGMSVNAQTPVELHITHKLSGQPFAFNMATQNNLGNDFNVTRLEYYISKISITHDGGTVTDVPDHYILANGSQDIMEALGSYNVTNVESVSFYIGVDSPNNNADPSLQPNGHPLAPKSPSMHWGWQAGYRFVAMEGKSGASLGQTYQVHALGNQNYFKVTVAVSGINQGGKVIIPLNADYMQAVKDLDLSSGLISHGDALEAAVLLENFRDNVFFPGHPVSVANAQKAVTQVSVFPNPSNGTVNINAGNAAADIQVTDVQGRTVATQHKASGVGNVTLKLNNAGLYFVKVTTAEGATSVQKLQVL